MHLIRFLIRRILTGIVVLWLVASAAFLLFFARPTATVARQLAGREATTYWLALEELGRLGAIPKRQRYVFDGKYVTGAGVSAGIDMALALAGRVAGDEEAKRIQLAIEYDPQPPYESGSPATASAEMVARFTVGSRFARV